jgi:H+/Cl- antiporter ClcA
MEKIAGVAIFLVGLLILFFGASTGREGGMMVYGVRVPSWADKLLQYGSGIVSIWFGAQLFFGNAHFF